MAINTYSFDVSSSNPAYAAISHANQTGLDINGNLTISFWVKDLSTVTSQVFTAVSLTFWFLPTLVSLFVTHKPILKSSQFFKASSM